MLCKKLLTCFENNNEASYFIVSQCHHTLANPNPISLFNLLAFNILFSTNKDSSVAGLTSFMSSWWIQKVWKFGITNILDEMSCNVFKKLESKTIIHHRNTAFVQYFTYINFALLKYYLENACLKTKIVFKFLKLVIFSQNIL